MNRRAVFPPFSLATFAQAQKNGAAVRKKFTGVWKLNTASLLFANNTARSYWVRTTSE